jgi:hypothetical protein
VDRKVTETCVPIAAVSMHALGRWHERSALRDHAALIVALAVLVDAPDGERMDTERDFPTPALTANRKEQGRIQPCTRPQKHQEVAYSQTGLCTATAAWGKTKQFLRKKRATRSEIETTISQPLGGREVGRPRS